MRTCQTCGSVNVEWVACKKHIDTYRCKPCGAVWQEPCTGTRHTV